MTKSHLHARWAVGVAGALLLSTSASAQTPRRKVAAPSTPVAILTLAPVYRMAGDTVRLARIGPGQLQLRLGGSLPATVAITDSAARAFVGDVRAYLARKRLADDCEMAEADTADVAPQLLGQAATDGSVTGLALRCDPPGPDSGSDSPATFTIVARLAAPDENGVTSRDMTLYASGSALRAFLLKVERVVGR